MLTSQNDESAILESIWGTIGTANRVLVDCGAFDLKQLSNVYDLWKEKGWRAILIEGNPVYYERMKKEKIPANVTLLNVMVRPQGERCLERLLDLMKVPLDFDLLSIDVDGIDYALWKELRRYKPRVVIIEYNPTIPPHLSVIGSESGNYLGASARALTDLAIAKGYALVACTKTNLIFVQECHADRFERANHVESLFDYSSINYVMTSYDGGLFYSNKFFPYGYNPFSDQPRYKMENSGQYFVPNQSLRSYIRLKMKYGWRRFRREVLKPFYFHLLHLTRVFSKI